MESGPTDGTTGELCPAGKYCESGTHPGNIRGCPGGTYSNVTGAVDSYDCTECEPGWYCSYSDPDRGSPTGMCDPGCYCTGASAISCQFNATRGTYQNSHVFK